MTPESINKLTRPRFGKRAIEELEEEVRDPKEREILNILKRSTELFEMTRPRFGKRA